LIQNKHLAKALCSTKQIQKWNLRFKEKSLVETLGKS